MSAIRIRGCTILPPLLDEEERHAAALIRQQAVEIQYKKKQKKQGNYYQSRVQNNGCHDVDSPLSRSTSASLQSDITTTISSVSNFSNSASSLTTLSASQSNYFSSAALVLDEALLKSSSSEDATSLILGISQPSEIVVDFGSSTQLATESGTLIQNQVHTSDGMDTSASLSISLASDISEDDHTTAQTLELDSDNTTRDIYSPKETNSSKGNSISQNEMENFITLRRPSQHLSDNSMTSSSCDVFYDSGCDADRKSVSIMHRSLGHSGSRSNLIDDYLESLTNQSSGSISGRSSSQATLSKETNESISKSKQKYLDKTIVGLMEEKIEKSIEKIRPRSSSRSSHSSQSSRSSRSSDTDRSIGSKYLDNYLGALTDQAWLAFPTSHKTKKKVFLDSEEYMEKTLKTSKKSRSKDDLTKSRRSSNPEVKSKLSASKSTEAFMTHTSQGYVDQSPVTAAEFELEESRVNKMFFDNEHTKKSKEISNETELNTTYDVIEIDTNENENKKSNMVSKNISVTEYVKQDEISSSCITVHEKEIGDSSSDESSETELSTIVFVDEVLESPSEAKKTTECASKGMIKVVSKEDIAGMTNSKFVDHKNDSSIEHDSINDSSINVSKTQSKSSDEDISNEVESPNNSLNSNSQSSSVQSSGMHTAHVQSPHTYSSESLSPRTSPQTQSPPSSSLLSQSPLNHYSPLVQSPFNQNTPTSLALNQSPPLSQSSPVDSPQNESSISPQLVKNTHVQSPHNESSHIQSPHAQSRMSQSFTSQSPSRTSWTSSQGNHVQSTRTSFSQNSGTHLQSSRSQTMYRSYPCDLSPLIEVPYSHSPCVQSPQVESNYQNSPMFTNDQLRETEPHKKTSPSQSTEDSLLDSQNEDKNQCSKNESKPESQLMLNSDSGVDENSSSNISVYTGTPVNKDETITIPSGADPIEQILTMLQIKQQQEIEELRKRQQDELKQFLQTMQQVPRPQLQAFLNGSRMGGAIPILNSNEQNPVCSKSINSLPMLSDSEQATKQMTSSLPVLNNAIESNASSMYESVSIDDSNPPSISNVCIGDKANGTVKYYNQTLTLSDQNDNDVSKTMSNSISSVASLDSSYTETGDESTLLNPAVYDPRTAAGMSQTVWTSSDDPFQERTELSTRKKEICSQTTNHINIMPSYFGNEEYVRSTVGAVNANFLPNTGENIQTGETTAVYVICSNSAMLGSNDRSLQNRASTNSPNGNINDNSSSSDRNQYVHSSEDETSVTATDIALGMLKKVSGEMDDSWSPEKLQDQFGVKDSKREQFQVGDIYFTKPTSITQLLKDNPQLVKSDSETDTPPPLSEWCSTGQLHSTVQHRSSAEQHNIRPSYCHQHSPIQSPSSVQQYQNIKNSGLDLVPEKESDANVLKYKLDNNTVFLRGLIRLQACVRRFLIKRLLQTKFVKEQLATLAEIANVAAQFHRDILTDNIHKGDVDFHKALYTQEALARERIRRVFVVLNSNEQMALIRRDRELIWMEQERQKERYHRAAPVQQTSKKSTSTGGQNPARRSHLYSSDSGHSSPSRNRGISSTQNKTKRSPAVASSKTSVSARSPTSNHSRSSQSVSRSSYAKPSSSNQWGVPLSRSPPPSKRTACSPRNSQLNSPRGSQYTSPRGSQLTSPREPKMNSPRDTRLPSFTRSRSSTIHGSPPRSRRSPSVSQSPPISRSSSISKRSSQMSRSSSMSDNSPPTARRSLYKSEWSSSHDAKLPVRGRWGANSRPVGGSSSNENIRSIRAQATSQSTRMPTQKSFMTRSSSSVTQKYSQSTLSAGSKEQPKSQKKNVAVNRRPWR
ncbi:unnamed protein product [Meganyctiphanes norvegica]|uniref:Centriolar coiled-coil protein of 110 kDa n=1 Tax=Meganyctiphanes norvegica TaxID=48144 RepID=A0AAV2QNF3_MEGNR